MTPRCRARAADPLPADLAGMSPVVPRRGPSGTCSRPLTPERTMYMVIRLALPTYMAG